MDLAHLDEVHADVLCQEQGLPVVELGTALHRLGRVNLDDGVLGCCAPAHFLRFFVGKRQVQERATTAAKSILFGTTCVPTTDTHIQELGRFGALARVYREGVSIEGANAPVLDGVAAASSGVEGLVNVRLLDVLTQTITQGVDDLAQISSPTAVQVQIEFLGTMPKHVGQGTGDSFGQGTLGHGCGRGHAGL